MFVLGIRVILCNFILGKIKIGMGKAKILSVLLSALMLGCGMAAAQRLVRPSALKPGDTVAIISPASACKAKYVTGACSVLRKWGYVPVVWKHALGKHGSFAGTIEERKSDLVDVITDPSVKAVLCSRGGYGSVQELCEMDLNLFARHPKWLIGYSDITAMHGAITSQGVMSIHGPMGEHLTKFAGTDSCSKVLHNILSGKMPHYKIAADPRNRQGKASGLLLGGNLALLNSFTASPIDMLSNYDDCNVILFVEDVGESLERLNRLFYTLRVNGTFDHIKGLVVGSFSDIKYTDDFPHVYDMVKSIVDAYDFPVAYGFPVGHTDNNYPMVEGAWVTLTVDANGAELAF